MKDTCIMGNENKYERKSKLIKKKKERKAYTVTDSQSKAEGRVCSAQASTNLDGKQKMANTIML